MHIIQNRIPYICKLLSDIWFIGIKKLNEKLFGKVFNIISQAQT